MLVLVAGVLSGVQPPPVLRARIQQKLTTEQAGRRAVLLTNAGLPSNCERLIGKPLDEFQELLSLANDVTVRLDTNQTRHVIRVAGSESEFDELIILSDGCRVTNAHYSCYLY